MRQTVLGVYDRHADACSAQRTLSDAGIARSDITVYSISASAPLEKGPRVYAPGSGSVRQQKPVFDQLEQLFARIFPQGEYPPDAEDYREFIRRGGTIVSADVSEVQVEMALDVMRRAGAADIEERAAAWRQRSGETGIPAHRGSSTVHESSARYDASVGQQKQDAEFSSVQPKIVSGMQQVTTRTQDPVDDLSTERRQQQTSEAPDVGSPRTLADVTAGVKSHASYPSERSPVPAQENSLSDRAGDPLMATPLDDDPYDAEFRRDFNDHYATTGGTYDEYRRAYTHGATLGHDEQYRAGDWESIEPSARENWEARYPESGWERFKAAVRHGWERVTGN
ncbi:hypothetical protein LJ655_10525 [Paraburkholderia sp. MMS20-SJTN17]|uniref:Uncharacterized protein n=1 Tax=Paraburkholderia translucens TaxID=2886945 RepID=A0ABS8KC62_9BURK|nr:hypothetical protein [Paraburkholderia sp. MMS20-SJTN17]MCC8402322.1 hypothetical protein [Paraburkholderia sp. MMS20-SJTN17]